MKPPKWTQPDKLKRRMPGIAKTTGGYCAICNEVRPEVRVAYPTMPCSLWEINVPLYYCSKLACVIEAKRRIDEIDEKRAVRKVLDRFEGRATLYEP